METIQLDKETFPEIRKMLGLKNLKCAMCKKRITKNNFGWLSKDLVVCSSLLCLAEAMEKYKEMEE